MSIVPVTRPTPEDIRREFARIVGASLRIDPARVTPDARLDELGAESIDLVEISMEVENAFSILMPERTILDTASEVLGDGSVVADGLLTALGSRLLQRRLPDSDPASFTPGTPVAEVNRLFLGVEVWLRLVEGIVERSPRACERCGTSLVQGAPAQLVCPSCGRVHPLPGGDDLNRDWVRGVAGELVDG